MCLAPLVVGSMLWYDWHRHTFSADRFSFCDDLCNCI